MHWKWLISGVPERRTHSHTHTNYILYLHYYSWRRLNVADDRLINWNFSVIFIYFGQRSKIRTACEASVWCSFCFCCIFFSFGKYAYWPALFHMRNGIRQTPQYARSIIIIKQILMSIWFCSLSAYSFCVQYMRLLLTILHFLRKCRWYLFVLIGRNFISPLLNYWTMNMHTISGNVHSRAGDCVLARAIQRHFNT